MLLSLKTNKSQSLPNIKANKNFSPNIATIKKNNISKEKQLLLAKNINPAIYPTITIMDHLNRRSIPKFNLNNIKNYSSILENKKERRIKEFEKFKIYKGTAMRIPNYPDLNINNKKEMEISKGYNKRNVYLFRKNFSYSCNMDKNDTFCLKLNKKLKKSAKQKKISSINEKINLENYEYRLPRMVNIIKKNNNLYDEVIYQPWKYPDLFQK